MATDIDFPVGLNPVLSGSLVEDATEPWVDDPVAVGSPRRRARFTRVLHRFSGTMLLETEAQKATLLAFYDTTLRNGVLSFNWTHPRTAVEYEVVFSQRPAPRHLEVEIYTVDFSVEEI